MHVLYVLDTNIHSLTCFVFDWIWHEEAGVRSLWEKAAQKMTALYFRMLNQRLDDKEDEEEQKKEEQKEEKVVVVVREDETNIHTCV